MPESELTIGELAQRAGVNVETVRYYQRIKLIAEPAKPQSGYRKYPLTVVDRIRFIKRAQQLGFSLQETKELLALGEGQCADVRARAIAKRCQIAEQINDLLALQNTLDTLIRQCNDESGSARCPIVQSLAGGNEAPPHPRDDRSSGS